MVNRSKSFTGCWTCRGRKIRCDLGQPSCDQCKKAKIECGGYSVRLVWGDDDTKESRRQVEFVKFPKHMMYDNYRALDDDLLQLDADSLEFPGETAIRGPFAVFYCTKKRPRQKFENYQNEAKSSFSQLEGPIETYQNNPDNEQKSSEYTSKKLKTTDQSQNQIIDPHHPLAVPDLPRTDYMGDNIDELSVSCDLGLPPGAGYSWGTADEILLSLEDNTFLFPDDYARPNVDSEQMDLLFTRTNGEGFPYLDTGYKGAPYTDRGSLRMTSLANLLLDHYQEAVMPYMSIVINPKNIWQSMYLPRVISALGDITYKGYTSFARETILHAVMSASAFNMTYKFPTNSPGYGYYMSVGQKMREYSQICLSKCFKEGRNVGKYKDFLVALHAIANIEYIKGDTVGRDVRVAAIQRLISLRLLNKPKVSHKATLLHKTCAMAVLLVRVAECWPNANDILDGEVDDSWIDNIFAGISPIQTEKERTRLQQLHELQSRQVPLSYMQNMEQLEDYFHQYNADIASSEVAFSAELMFAIPESLVYLFKQAVQDSRAALWEREDQGHAESFTPELSLRCTILEAALQNWRYQYNPPEIDVIEGDEESEFKARRLTVINHHSMAFYEALIIYHYRVAKNVHLDLLQPHVVRVIEHLEAINYENSQTRGRPIAIPYLFAGFVGACEVAESNFALMARFKTWFNQMGNYRLANYKETAAVVDEIHRRRKLGQHSCDWWTLVREQGVSFSLQ